ncbi:Bug family tripartite tricarboxylate transporter substrate binding protein [Muricoccus radiodurans]|uniref:Bug family tripartite tricarboxylate transporter substrate binding protein n=1 Tax=Muricoccus radiodurans TaxID=2231721 RepID=UPI003CEE4F13
MFPARRGISRRRLSAVLGGAALIPSLARAQADFPNRPVRIVAGFAAGGGIDLVARLLAEPMRVLLGQPVVVENHAGASGQIGAQVIARSPPDGYSILLGSAGEIAAAPQLYGSRLAYDPATAFLPLSLAVRVPNLLAVGAGVPANSVAELVAMARARPGELSYGSGGVGNLTHLNGELFDRVAGVRMVHIPYRGTGALLADVASGRVTMTFAGPPGLLPLIRDGKMKAIGLTSRERMASLPGIPAIAEHPPLAAYEMVNWYGFFAPAGTPAPVVDRLNGAITAALRDPEVVRRLAEQGCEAAPTAPEEFRRFVAAETEKLGRLIREADIRPEG